MIRALAVVLFLLPAAALAQTFPALYDVTGVAADDVLNIRAAPDAATENLGELAPDAKAVEVIEAAGDWGQVNTGEASGWVAMRFLTPQTGGDYALSRSMTCLGTEPFWTLDVTQGELARFAAPNWGISHYTVGLLQRSANRTDRFVLRGGSLVAVIARNACSDGMSERAYGLSVDLLPDAESGSALFSGCCSLTGN